ncbi:MAG: hypothetical protein EXS37_05440 [Opitutus sp.]|nr:hypothetical protein [Opitutus sp.]
MLQPAPTAKEFFWDDLLEYIEEKRMIPIVGAELLTVPDGAGGELPLMRVLAQKLAERLRVPAEDCTGDDALHQVVSRYIQRGGRREEVYPRIRTLMKELAPAVPPILRVLARIRHFNLFVTTTADSLIAQALNEERFGSENRTVSLAYSPNSNTDIAVDARQSGTPTVFHLLGKMSASPDYVITEEDTLEFFTAIQSESKRPNVLLDELKTSHLLLIGQHVSRLARALLHPHRQARPALAATRGTRNHRRPLRRVGPEARALPAQFFVSHADFSTRQRRRVCA